MNKYIEKFRANELLIHESKFWYWTLRQEQPTLGSSLIILKRTCENISEVTEEEFKDYLYMIKLLEGSLQSAFNYSKINYLALMMVDKQVHYHVIPRYDRELVFLNESWFDYGWPGLPELNKINKINTRDIMIIEYIKKEVSLFLKEKYLIGYTTGVFDLFHVGHLNILKKAKEQCDFLIVGVTTDELVAYKNKKAVINLEDRMEILSGIKYVDKIVIQSNMNKMEAWKKYKFNIMFVGSDWQGTEKWNNFEEEFSEVGVRISYIPYTERVSSTLLREQLKISGK
jgi:glycerol-3-phosphate cytidylyltransferase